MTVSNVLRLQTDTNGRLAVTDGDHVWIAITGDQAKELRLVKADGVSRPSFYLMPYFPTVHFRRSSDSLVVKIKHMRLWQLSVHVEASPFVSSIPNPAKP